MRESNHVTKVFEVEFSPPPPLEPGDDDIGFQEDLDKEQTRVCYLFVAFVYGFY